MKVAMDETERRRGKQEAFNTANGITPRSIIKPVKDIIDGVTANDASWNDLPEATAVAEGKEEYSRMTPKELGKLLARLEKEMYAHAKNLEFEQAAQVRDRIARIRDGRFLLTATD